MAGKQAICAGAYPRPAKPGAGEIPSRDIVQNFITAPREIGVVRHENVLMPRSRWRSSSRSNTRAGGIRVQIAGRLVGQEQARAARERPRDRDPLLLASREGARPVTAALGEADPREQLRAPAAGPPGPRSPAMRCGKATFSSARELRQQVVELEDEADRSRFGTARAPAAGIAASDGPKTSTRPASGRSMPPSRCRKVDLPTPEGPMTAAKTPSGEIEGQVPKDRDGRALAAVGLRQVRRPDGEHR